MIYQEQFSLEQSRRIARAKEPLGRLKANHNDAIAVMAFYGTCGRELQEVAVRHFGKNELAKKAILNLLVALVSGARIYDLQTLWRKEWIVQCADAEAKKLLAAVDAGRTRGRRTRVGK